MKPVLANVKSAYQPKSEIGSIKTTPDVSLNLKEFQHQVFVTDQGSM